MRSFAYLATVMAVTVGCTGDHDKTSVDPGGTQDVSVAGGAAGQTGANETQTPPAACAAASAPGTVLARTQFSEAADGAGLTMNASGEVAFNSNVVSGFTPEGRALYVPGVAKLDAQLNKLYDYPYGSAIALDAAGNAYVAGGFSSPTDFGLGVVEPTGNIDTFLAVLGPNGEVTSVRHLGILCGDGVIDIAVAADGRIALSGSAMGTVVLENAAGDIVFQSPASGHLAFDAAGNLVVGGSFTGQLDLGGGNVLVAGSATDVDGFIAKLDADGNVMFSRTFGDAALPVRVLGFEQDRLVTDPLPQAIADVAVNANGDIAVSGTYDSEMDLYGQTLKTGSFFPSGTQRGTFLARLDGAGNATYSRDGGAINAFLGTASVAIGADGRLAFSSNDPGNAQGPWAYPSLSTVTGAGVSAGLAGGGGFAGYGLGVAFDGCGNLLWASHQNEPSIFDPHTFLTLFAQ